MAPASVALLIEYQRADGSIVTKRTRVEQGRDSKAKFIAKVRRSASASVTQVTGVRPGVEVSDGG